MNDHQSVLLQLNEADRHCADPVHRGLARIAAGRIREALAAVAELPSFANMRALTGQMAYGLRVYTLMPDMPEPPPNVGGRVDVKKAS